MVIDTVIKALTPVIESLFPDPKQRDAAKLKLLDLAQNGTLRDMEIRGSIIETEAKGESWLQRNWRPITMLTFTGLVVAHWLGFTASNLKEAEILSLLDIVKVGLGGYVVGRSAEKVATVWRGK